MSDISYTGVSSNKRLHIGAAYGTPGIVYITIHSPDTNSGVSVHLSLADLERLIGHVQRQILAAAPCGVFVIGDDDRPEFLA